GRVDGNHGSGAAMNRTTRRRGAVFLLVLVLAPVLSLGAYAFVYAMRAEARGAGAAVQRGATRALAQSGVAYVAALLSDPATFTDGEIDLDDDPASFAAYEVGAAGGGPRGLFTVASPSETTPNALRYGLTRESGKFPLGRGADGMNREGLLLLPNMTAELADALVDWMDADDLPKFNGAESEYYGTLSPPIQPRNGVPQSVGELLQVRGMTVDVLYGEDVNADGLLNPNENDGDASWPIDDADGVLNRGLAGYFTLYSTADPLNPRGAARVNLNGSDAAALKQSLTQLFDENTATFIAAYKAEKQKIGSFSELIDATAAAAPTPAVPSGAPGNDRPFPLVDVVDVATGSRGGEQPPASAPRLNSPWTSANAGAYLEKALTELSLSDEKTITNRMDVSAASAEALALLPGVTPALAERIATAARNRTAVDKSIAWLLVDQVATLEQFKTLEPLLVSDGRTFSFAVVGFFENGGPTTRLHAVVDAASTPAKIVRLVDRTPLGAGYTLPMLRGDGSTAPVD
ncbi:MAG: hypothetical protein ACRC1K_12930, partial [Planctomycetia bacterium]